MELVLSQWKPLTFPEEGRIVAWGGTVTIPGTSEWETEYYAKMDARICLYKAPHLSHKKLFLSCCITALQVTLYIWL